MAVRSYTKKTGSKQQKNSAGRPTVINAEVVSVLVSSFNGGMTVREACWQSGISHEAYYNRLRSDEQFTDTMTRAQAVPTMNARRVVVEAISKGDVSASKWWLERKSGDEFGSNPATIQVPEARTNRFATMSDEELSKLGAELSYLILAENDIEVTDPVISEQEVA